MPGKRITDQQRRLYMEARSKGKTQKIAAAQAGFCERSARNIFKNPSKKERTWRTRENPFQGVWEREVVPLLEQNPKLQAKTLLYMLQEKYPGKYPDSKLRTLERRIKDWKVVFGPEKEVIFRQKHPPGWQGISDFTNCNALNVTIQGKPLDHILYHFRLPYSGAEHADVILGGESFTALAEKLQDAFWAIEGAPKTHRTDSLSAAFKNLNSREQEDLTQAYEELCKHYGIRPTRNNKGVSHENGSIESSHRHLKNRIDQALMIRGSRDFGSVPEYREFIHNLILKHNQRIQKSLLEERQYLLPLPKGRTIDFTEERVSVTTCSTITVKSVIYSVPSKLIGAALKVHLYDDRLECFCGGMKVITLPRYRNHKKGKHIDYRHLIGSLSRKPQAFRNFVWKEYMFPTFAFRQTWELFEENLDDRKSCREYVKILKEASVEGREGAVNEYLEKCIESGSLPKSEEVAALFNQINKGIPEQKPLNIDLKTYDQLFFKMGGAI